MNRPTIQQRLTVVKHLANGHTLEFVEKALPDLTADQIQEIASSHGHPYEDELDAAVETLTKQIGDLDELPPSSHGSVRSGPRQPDQTHEAGDDAGDDAAVRQPDEIHVLLNTAKQSGSKRTQNLADQILDRVGRLRDLVQAEQEEAAARAAHKAAQRRAAEEVRQAEAKLKAAKNRYRKVKNRRPTAAPAPTTTAPKKRATTSRQREILGRHGVRLDDIRQWGRANGYQIADRGVIAQAVLEAYDTAHTTDASGSAA